MKYLFNFMHDPLFFFSRVIAVKIGSFLTTSNENCKTRMHSSRVRTVRCSNRLLEGGGLSAQAECLPRGSVCLPRGCLPRGCLPRSVYPAGVCLPARAGVCLVCPGGGGVWQTPPIL